MRKLQKLCAAAVLTCVLAVSASAGHISAGGVTDPPPPPAASETETTEGDMHAGGVMAVLLSLLSVF